MQLLDQITKLSHEFGGPDYVKGGGGNTSVKTADTLWVKPSGATLAGMAPDRFVALDRARLGELFGLATPDDPHAREALVKDCMAAAVKPGSTGRPSVEAPLHDVLEAVFVVHTHAVLVNGLTCARDGAVAAERLFPDALWAPYIDPGYTLCMDLRHRVRDYVAQHGAQPAVILLGNHGIFVAGNTPAEIREQYRQVTATLRAAYQRAGVATELVVGPPPARAAAAAMFRQLGACLGADAAAIAVAGKFAAPLGPISPDHIVYAKSFPYHGAPSGAGIAAYRARHGCLPRVFIAADAVYTAGPSEKLAQLALDLAQDGALLQQLATAFGGIELLTDAQRLFIENWEVEAYRQKQV